jgi:SDR family mycofactocin-dependent oxidoreductase
MGCLDGRVAFVTGAGRGQGRSHAVRMAAEGADIIAVDVPDRIGWLGYETATEDDLAITIEQVQQLGRKIVARVADVRDGPRLQAVVDEGVDQLGRLDIVVANAGIGPLPHRFWEIPDDEWTTMLDVNLTGVWRTVSSAVPAMLSRDDGGSIILITSSAALAGGSNVAAYVAAKIGVIGLVKTMARELAHHSIRVNAISPSNVDTDMIHNEATYRLFRADVASPTREDVAPAFARRNLLPRPWSEPEEISDAVVFLASDRASSITGVTLPVDLGGAMK